MDYRLISFILLMSLATSVSAQVEELGFGESIDDFFGKISYGMTGRSCSNNPSDLDEYAHFRCGMGKYFFPDENTYSSRVGLDSRFYENATDSVIFNTAADSVYSMNKCQKDFYSKYFRDRDARSDLLNRSLASFNELKDKIIARKREVVRVNTPSASERVSLPCTTSTDCVQMHLALDNRVKEALERDTELSEIIAAIPMGNRPKMRNHILSIVNDDKLKPDEFYRGFDGIMRELQTEAKTSFDGINKYRVVQADGDHHFNVDPELRQSLISNGIVANILTEHGLEEYANSSNFMCRIDRRDEGMWVGAGVEVLGALATAYITGGTTGVATPSVLATMRTGSILRRLQNGAATSKQIAAGMSKSQTAKLLLYGAAVSGEAMMTYKDIDRTCFTPEYMTSISAQTCSAESQFYNVVAEANIAACTLSSAMGIALPVSMGGLRRLKVNRAREAARVSDDGVETPAIVVSGSRRRKRREPKRAAAAQEAVERLDRKKNRVIRDIEKRIELSDTDRLAIRAVLSEKATERLAKVLDEVGDEIQNKAQLNYVIDELSGLSVLTKEAQQEAVEALIKKLKRPTSTTFTGKLNDKFHELFTDKYTQKLMIYRHNKAKKILEATRENVRKENPSFTAEQVETHAIKISAAKRFRTRQLARACTDKNFRGNAVARQAGMTYAKVNVGFSIASAGVGFGAANWDALTTGDRKAEFATRLGYEVFMAATMTYIGSKISGNQTSGFVSKLKESYVKGAMMQTAENAAYATIMSFFMDDEGKAKAKLEELTQSETFEDDIQELVNYLESRPQLAQVVDQTGDTTNEILTSLFGQERAEQMTYDDLLALDQQMLEDPTVREQMMDHLEDYMFSQDEGENTSGARMIDKFLYDGPWNLHSIPRGLIVGLASYQAICRNLDRPALGIASLLALQGVNRFGAGYLYFEGRKNSKKNDEEEIEQ